MRLAFGLVGLGLVACATPYQSRGFRGGYDEKQLGPDRYMITVKVNSYTSRSTAVEYSYRRAAELCPGGFDPIDADRESLDFYIRNSDGTYYNAPKASAMLVVQCRRVVAATSRPSSNDVDTGDAEPTNVPERPSRTTAPAMPPNPSTEKGFWCTSRGDFGACFKKPGACELYRREVTGKHCATNLPGSCPMAMGACAEQPRAICAAAGCYTTPLACADAETAEGRDGAACVVRD
jgi:hypothetical protein